MNQEPPAPPLHCQHNASSWKSLIFNDSWAARAAHPTAETMQTHGNLGIFNESRAARASHPIAQTMKMHGNPLIFNNSRAAKAAHPTAETMQMH